MSVNCTIRPGYFVVFSACTAWTSRSPDVPLALTRTRRLLASMPATTRAICVSAMPGGWWLWMSITGNFAFGTGCSTVLSVVRGLYWVMVGSGNSGVRPSPGRRIRPPVGRPGPAGAGACSASTRAAPVSSAAASQIVVVRISGGPRRRMDRVNNAAVGL
jgi:hypothetical protein